MLMSNPSGHAVAKLIRGKRHGYIFRFDQREREYVTLGHIWRPWRAICSKGWGLIIWMCWSYHKILFPWLGVFKSLQKGINKQPSNVMSLNFESFYSYNLEFQPTGIIERRCLCRPGFQGRRCELSARRACSVKPCANGATCVDDRSSTAGHRCLCRPGYGGLDCSVDIDDCQPNPCLNGRWTPVLLPARRSRL